MENYRGGGSNAYRKTEYTQRAVRRPQGIVAAIAATDNMRVIDDKSVAMAYVPWQRWSDVYPPERALECGTLFPELHKPFMGRR